MLISMWKTHLITNKIPLTIYDREISTCLLSLIFAEKRYKLINFAPKLEIVDKIHYRLIINKKESTSIVNK